MRISTYRLVSALAAAGFSNAQSDDLVSALQGYDDLSLFSSLVSSSSTLFDSVVGNNTSNTTVLVPSNDAVNTYLSKSGIADVWSISYDDVQTLFSYHLIPASLKGSDFEAMGTAAIPTFLKTEEFNNRGAGEVIKDMFGSDATGQVVIATTSKSSKKFRRANDNPTTVDLRAGLAQDVTMTAIDGTWGSKGSNSFHMVDNVLSPPVLCSKTVRTIGDDRLTALDTSLNKTNLWTKINTTPSISCLSPSTEAFKKDGNPQDKPVGDELEDLMFSHYLNHTTYTDELEDGQVFQTMYDTTITVHIKGDDIYFNNAKIIKANVLTSNGVLHILDAVIKPESSKTGSSDSSSTSGSSSSTESSEDSSGVNIAAMTKYGLVTLAAALLMV